MPPKPGIKPRRNSGKAKRAILSATIDVACQGEFKAATEADAVYGGDGNEWRGVYGVEHGVYPLEELADAGEALLLRERLSGAEEFAEVGSRGKAFLASARNDAGCGFGGQRRNCCGELSRSAKVSVPISLAGPWSNVNSTTPSRQSQRSVFPAKCFIAAFYRTWS